MFVRTLAEGKFGRQYFNMRLAPEDVNDALSGYSHNAVSPIGMAVRLPMVISHKIAELEPNSFFLGAGEVDLKVGQLFMSAYIHDLVSCSETGNVSQQLCGAFFFVCA